MAYPADPITTLIAAAEAAGAPKQALTDVLRALGDPAFTRYDAQNNLLRNGNVEYWPAGTAAAPRDWTLVGASATVARDATNKKLGLYGAAVTRAGTDCYLNQDVDAGPFVGLDWLKGTRLALGCWVRATVASRARVGIVDSAGSSFSSYHSGGSTWEWLPVTRVIDASATSVDVRLQVDTGNTTAQFDGAVLVMGDRAPGLLWHPNDWRCGARLTRAAKSFTTGVTAAIDWDAEPIDDYNFWDVGNATRITAPFAGTLQLTLRASWASGGGTQRAVDALLNGATGLEAEHEFFAATHAAVQNLHVQRRLAAGDYIELRGFQDSGGNLNLTPSVEVYLVGP